MVVTISTAVAARLREYAEAAYPDEGCGVMIGALDGDSVSVTEVTPGRNLVTDRSRDRYVLAPEDILAAGRSARGRGLDIVGFWHTHPDHPARPSQFDLDHAWTDYVYVICRVAWGVCEVINGFALPAAGEQFEQVEMTVAPARSVST